MKILAVRLRPGRVFRSLATGRTGFVLEARESGPLVEWLDARPGTPQRRQLHSEVVVAIDPPYDTDTAGGPLGPLLTKSREGT